MQIKELIEEIITDVSDVATTTFEFSQTRVVPNRSDSQLTFERNITKRGKILKTCVLYADIRDSVALTEKHHSLTMGKIYTAFTKAVLKAAKYHSGHIRNIIGDRVMIVFPSENCFTNAVHCAISINHIAREVIRPKFPGVDFKCGIGIDYGDLKVIKVGVQRRGHEGTENRSLVWTGYPANLASRLTDVANKNIDETIYEVKRNPINFAKFSTLYFLPESNIFKNYGGDASKEPTYLSKIETIELSPEDFANSISMGSDGSLFMTGGKLISFTKKIRQISFSEILLSREVFNGYKAANPQSNDILADYWKLQKSKIKNVNKPVYGANLIWTIK